MDKYICVTPGQTGVSRYPVDTHTAAVDDERLTVANERSLLLRASGDYVPNTLPGEIWQNDIRLIMVFGAPDPIGTLPNNWDPESWPISRTETDWNITSNWRVSHVGAGFSPDDYLNDQAAPAWASFMSSANLSNQCRLRTLELFPIGSPDGNAVPAPPYAHGTPATLTWTSSYPVGGSSSTQLPPQDSIAVSWKTGQVGPRGRGRMFLPSATSAALSGGHVATTPQSDITAAAVALLEGLAYTGSGIGSVNVRPIVTGKPFEQYGVITQASVGSIVDTQRRRRNRLTEVYVTGTPSY